MIVLRSEKYVIIASDSGEQIGDKVTSDGCKVSGSSNTVGALSGNGGIGSVSFINLAQKAVFDPRQNSSADLMNGVKLWTSQVVPMINKHNKDYPKEWATLSPKDRKTVGIFFAMIGGRIFGVGTVIAPSQSGNIGSLKVSAVNTELPSAREKDEVMKLYTGDIAEDTKTELYAGQTPRAKAQKPLLEELMTPPLTDVGLRNLAEKFTQVGIDWHPHHGRKPIQIIELSDNGVKWWKINPHCK